LIEEKEKKISEEFETIKKKTNFQISSYEELQQKYPIPCKYMSEIDTTTCCPRNIRA